jgi:hypothetical protein
MLVRKKGSKELQKKTIFKKKFKQFTKIQSKKKAFPIVNFFRVTAQSKFFNRQKKFFNDGLKLKKSIQTFFDHSLSIPNFKNVLLKDKQKSRFLCFILILIKPFFRLDILLWKLKKFNSTFSARQAIYSGVVLINNSLITQVLMINLNDVITFRPFFVSRKIKHVRKFEFLLFFLEFDLYSDTFIYFKEFCRFTSNDLALLYFKYIKTRLLRNYILKK